MIKHFLTSAAVVCLGALGSAQSQVGPPDASFFSSDKSGAVVSTSYEGLEGVVSYDVTGRRVLITWWRTFLEQETKEMSSQEEPCSFWPTEVCSFGMNRICVAGKNAKAQTIIKLWEFSAAETLEDPTIDPMTGATVFPDTIIPVVTTTTVYQGNTSGRRLVRAMFANHALPNRLFVLFDDSRDLCDLNVSSASIGVVLTKLQEPLLGNVLGNRTSWDHGQFGYMYHFSRGVGEMDPPESLILIDSNRDGSIEAGSTMHLSAPQWNATFQDRSLFLRQF